MPYLDFIKPIEEKEVFNKIQTSHDRSVWLLDVLNFIMALLKNQFMGKVINVKLSKAIKDKKEENKIDWVEDGDRFLSANSKRALKIHSSINRDWVLYMDVMINAEDGRLDWDTTVQRANAQTIDFREAIKQSKQLLDHPGIVKGLITDWERSIQVLKGVNKEASKYDVLTYEFDLSRYK